MSKINNCLRHIYNFYLRKKLKNTTFTLISSNCNGGCILRDLGLEFNTPFVNLVVAPADFIKLCGNLEYYLHCELTFIDSTKEGLSYPVGKLDDIKIYFVHYLSEADALSSWDRRRKRVNFNDIFLLFTDRGGCTYDMLKTYDALGYENKVVFCNREYPEIKYIYPVLRCKNV